VEGELIAVSVISGIFGIIGIYILNMNWFKKENFRIQRDNIKAENKLKLKKLERELGLQKGAPAAAPAPAIGGDLGGIIGALAPLAKNLSGDQIQQLAEMFLNYQQEGGSEPGGIGETLANFYGDNKEMVDGLLQGIGNKLQENKGGQETGY